MSFTTEQIMKAPVITVDAYESLARANGKMNCLGIGGLPVLDNGKLVGILTSRDVRRSHPNRLVADAMTKEPITIEKSKSLWAAHQIMVQRDIERLPVMEGENLVGMITKSDVFLELGKQTDPLTGVKSSGFLHYVGETLLTEGKEITVIFFDIDDFGKFNKDHGHVAGDKCLKNLSLILSRAIMLEKDYLCRYGGDEFVVLTTRQREKAVEWVEQILNKINQGLENNNFQIGVSAGIATGGCKDGLHSSAGVVLEQLVNTASLASTKAKNQGSVIQVA
ncbi:MAG: CBS domain-containing protein [Bacillota bacterium]